MEKNVQIKNGLLILVPSHDAIEINFQPAEGDPQFSYTAARQNLSEIGDLAVSAQTEYQPDPIFDGYGRAIYLQYLSGLYIMIFRDQSCSMSVARLSVMQMEKFQNLLGFSLNRPD
jgi:hypothetical protein